MSALTLLLQLLKPGDVIVAAHDCYGGTQRLLRGLAKRGHFGVVFADLTSPSALDTITRIRPRLVLIETPSNPLLRITDVRVVADCARAAGAIVAVDNTFLSPALQQPIALGADIVVHSTTKYLNGHSDVVGGSFKRNGPVPITFVFKAFTGSFSTMCLGIIVFQPLEKIVNNSLDGPLP